MNVVLHNIGRNFEDRNWDAAIYATNSWALEDSGSSLVRTLAPKRQEVILDLGCGDGVLTCKILEKTKNVVGVDNNIQQVRKASKNGIFAMQMDACELSFENMFDGVFSHAVIHWVSDVKALLEKVYVSLKSRGRFVADFGGVGNLSKIIETVYACIVRRKCALLPTIPWTFLELDMFGKIAEDAGFTVKSLVKYDIDVDMGDGLEAWLEVFCDGFLKEAKITDNRIFVNEVLSSLKMDCRGSFLDYKRIRFVGIKN